MRTLQLEIDRSVALVNLAARTAAAMATVLEAFGEQDVTLTDADVAALGAVLDELRGVLACADRDGAATRLNALLAANAGPPRLVEHEGWGWHVHVDRADDAPWSEWLASSAALALATRLVATPDGDVPWGLCAAGGCTNAFVHDGRGGARHWCSTTCASRERVRRHRQRVSDRRTRPGRSARGGATATA